MGRILGDCTLLGNFSKFSPFCYLDASAAVDASVHNSSAPHGERSACIFGSWFRFYPVFCQVLFTAGMFLQCHLSSSKGYYAIDLIILFVEQMDILKIKSLFLLPNITCTYSKICD